MSRRSLFGAAVWVMLAAELALVWSHRYFPSQDGPIHLELSWLIDRLVSAEPGVLGRYFHLDLGPEPNLAVYPLLLLLRWLVPLWAVDKIFISLYYVAWILGMRSLLGSLGQLQRVPELVVAGFALAPNFLLHMGFWNFSLGFAFALSSVGFAWRRRVETPPAGHLAIGLLLLVTALFHIVALGTALIVLGCLHAAEAMSAERPLRLRWLDLARRARNTVLVALPALLLTVSFLGRAGGTPVVWWSFRRRLEYFLRGEALVSFHRQELLFSTLLAGALGMAVLLCLLIRSRTGRQPERYGWLLALAVLTGCYFALPNGLAHGGYLNQRLLLGVLVAALGVVAAAPERRTLHLLLGVVALCAWAGQHRLHWVRYGQINRGLSAFVAVAPQVPVGSTMVAVAPHRFLDRRLRALGFRVRPFQHAGSYVAMARGAVNLADSLAHQTYFPVRYRESMDPYVHLVEDPDVEELKGKLDFARFNRGQRRCEVVYLFARPAAMRKMPRLTELYELTRSGSQPYPWSLYRLRPVSGAGRSPS
jgi:hypothetical protein